MTNYDMDEMRRRSERQADYDGSLGQTDTVSPEWNARRSDEDMTEKRRQFAQDLIDTEKDQTVTIDLDIADEDFVHLAKAAHERNITLNQLCIDVLKNAFDDLDYRFEHGNKKLLKEYYFDIF